MFALKQYTSKRDFDDESKVLKDLTKTKIASFPIVRDELSFEGMPSIVMDLYDSSLLTLKAKEQLSEADIFSIAIQMTQVLASLHSHGYVHCDVKPDNIMLTRERTVVLIDFGLAHKFVDESGTHMPEQKVRTFKGTWMYSSKNSVQRLRQTRRDDLESLLYVVMRLCGVRMPWMPPNVTPNKKNFFKEMGLKKRNMSDAEIQRRLPERFRALYMEIRTIGYATKPDYEKICKYYEDLLDGPFPLEDKSRDSSCQLALDQASMNRATRNDFSNITIMEKKSVR